MDIHNLWPTQMGQGKFDTTGLVEHIFSTYNLNEPPSDLGGYNILDDKSAVMSAFNSTVKSLLMTT